mmetsp:Transcript_16233/g.31295  ORF Transcript_16233/g.31295 Transcript_16233/m.31295 type:complete len:231 (-) Transcript_16233:394-1086(-)
MLERFLAPSPPAPSPPGSTVECALCLCAAASWSMSHTLMEELHMPPTTMRLSAETVVQLSRLPAWCTVKKHTLGRDDEDSATRRRRSSSICSSVCSASLGMGIMVGTVRAVASAGSGSLVAVGLASSFLAFLAGTSAASASSALAAICSLSTTPSSESCNTPHRPGAAFIAVCCAASFPVITPASSSSASLSASWSGLPGSTWKATRSLRMESSSMKSCSWRKRTRRSKE